MPRTKHINLTASVVTALEATKQALEVLHGFEVSFAQNLQIEICPIEIESDRSIGIKGQYRQRCDDNCVSFSTMIHLRNHGDGWLPDLIMIGEEGVDIWRWASWGRCGDDKNTVRVRMGLDENRNHIYRVGHGLRDFHIETTPTATK